MIPERVTLTEAVSEPPFASNSTVYWGARTASRTISPVTRSEPTFHASPWYVHPVRDIPSGGSTGGTRTVDPISRRTSVSSVPTLNVTVRYRPCMVPYPVIAPLSFSDRAEYLDSARRTSAGLTSPSEDAAMILSTALERSSFPYDLDGSP